MPEHERVAGKARVNVAGSSAEPIGDDVGDRGSLLVSVGEFAELARRRARSTDTNELSARLWSDRRCGELGRVLNLCEGGMLLESSSDPEVAEGVGFELVGPGFRYAGEQGMLIDGLALAPVGARIRSCSRTGVPAISAVIASRIGRSRAPGLRSITGMARWKRSVVSLLARASQLAARGCLRPRLVVSGSDARR